MRDDSTETLQEHQNVERPAKKANRNLDEHRQNSAPLEEGHSAMTLVDEDSPDSSKRPDTIPYIDLTKVKTSGKKSSQKLRIYVIPQSRPSSSRSRSLSSCVMTFSVAGSSMKASAAPLYSLPTDVGFLECLDSKLAKPFDIFKWTRLHSFNIITDTLTKPSAAASSTLR